MRFLWLTDSETQEGPGYQICDAWSPPVLLQVIINFLGTSMLRVKFDPQDAHRPYRAGLNFWRLAC
jgi:hypothetical protein